MTFLTSVHYGLQHPLTLLCNFKWPVTLLLSCCCSQSLPLCSNTTNSWLCSVDCLSTPQEQRIVFCLTGLQELNDPIETLVWEFSQLPVVIRTVYFSIINLHLLWTFSGKGWIGYTGRKIISSNSWPPRISLSNSVDICRLIKLSHKFILASDSFSLWLVCKVWICAPLRQLRWIIQSQPRILLPKCEIVNKEGAEMGISCPD